MTHEEYWQLYLSRVDSITLRQQLHIHNKSILDLLSRFNPDFPMSLDIGPGWIYIISDLNEQISYIDPHYKIAQIKQKFGTLRYYIDLSFDKDHYVPSDIVRILIANAENLSSHTCEQCGELGRLTSTYWRKTLCDSCAL